MNDARFEEQRNKAKERIIRILNELRGINEAKAALERDLQQALQEANG